MNRLLRFLFRGEVDPTFKIRRTKANFPEGNPSPPHDKPSADSRERFKLVMLFSWVLSIAFFICLIAAIVLYYNGKPVPDFLILIIGGVPGYFGGAISVYFGFQPPR